MNTNNAHPPSLSSGGGGGGGGDSTYHHNVCVRFQKHINTIAVDRNGEFCVLGGKKSLYVVNLEEPKDLAKTISNPNSKWEVGIMEWNPHASKSTLIASAANQEVVVWDSTEGRMVLSIPPHQRAVSDISWSPFEPNVLVTASLDTYINLWDIRDPHRPTPMKRFSKHIAAVQAKWNRRNPAILATAHEGNISIWDIRKDGMPLTSITAHNTQIYGIDWSYLDQNEIISCSQDRMVKVWSIDNPREYKLILQTGTPVLRAKYLPYGSGIVTAAVGNFALRLWSIKDTASSTITTPTHSFIGHTDGIRSFDWRVRGQPTMEEKSLEAIQMVSWSKDQSLRLWSFDNAHLAACGIYPSSAAMQARRASVYFFGDLPADSPSTPTRSPHPPHASAFSSPFSSGKNANNSFTPMTPTSTTTNTSAGGAGGSSFSSSSSSAAAGDVLPSLAEGYFGAGGGMEDLLETGHSDEGEEFRKSLDYITSSWQQSSAGAGGREGGGGEEGRETKGDGGERRGDRDGLEGIQSRGGGGEVGAGGGMGMRGSGYPTPTSPPPAEDFGLVPGNLEHEFLLLTKKKFPGISVVQTNSAQRTCIVHVTINDQQKFQLKITFPSLYPHNASPSFEISDVDNSILGTPTSHHGHTPSVRSPRGDSVPPSTPPPSHSLGGEGNGASFRPPPVSPLATRAHTRFLEALKRVADNRVSHNMPCIENCLVKLVQMLKEDAKLAQNRQQAMSATSPRGEEGKRGDDATRSPESPTTATAVPSPPPPSLTTTPAPPAATPLPSTSPRPPSFLSTTPTKQPISYGTPRATSPDMSLPPSQQQRISPSLLTVDKNSAPKLSISPTLAFTALSTKENGPNVQQQQQQQQQNIPPTTSPAPTTTAGINNLMQGSNIDLDFDQLHMNHMQRMEGDSEDNGNGDDDLMLKSDFAESYNYPPVPSVLPKHPPADDLVADIVSLRESASLGVYNIDSNIENSGEIGRRTPISTSFTPSTSFKGEIALHAITRSKSNIETLSSSGATTPTATATPSKTTADAPSTSLLTVNSISSTSTWHPSNVGTSNRSLEGVFNNNNNNNNASDTSAPTGTIRRSVSMGSSDYRRYNKENEAAMANIPAPRMCSVAISPTGKLVYFQSLRYKAPAMPTPSPSSSSSPTPPIPPPTISLSPPDAPAPIVTNATAAENTNNPTDNSSAESPAQSANKKRATTPTTASSSTATNDANTDANTDAPVDGDAHSDSSGTNDTEPIESDTEEEEEEVGPENGDAAPTSAAASTEPHTTSAPTATGIKTIKKARSSTATAATAAPLLPLVGTFPRTYHELLTLLANSKTAGSVTTTDTSLLAQLKSLHTLRVSTKIYMVDISSMMAINSELASSYRLMGNIQEVCAHNQLAARNAGRMDLVKVWRTLYVLCNPAVYGRPPTSPGFGGISGGANSAFFRDAWTSLPIARNLVSNIFKHYEKVGDVQTLAMMSCILLQSKLNLRTTRKRHISLDEENEISLIDPKKEPIANAYRYAYGEILCKWGLLVKRAELLKHMYGGYQFSSSSRNHGYGGGGSGGGGSVGSTGSYIPPPSRGIIFGVVCYSCGTKLKDGFFCANCKTFGFKCAICNIAVRGLSNFCILCGHGGHSHHISKWFERESYCPTGCGCKCIFDGPPLFKDSPDSTTAATAGSDDINNSNNNNTSNNSSIAVGGDTTSMGDTIVRARSNPEVSAYAENNHNATPAPTVTTTTISIPPSSSYTNLNGLISAVPIQNPNNNNESESISTSNNHYTSNHAAENDHTHHNSFDHASNTTPTPTNDPHSHSHPHHHPHHHAPKNTTPSSTAINKLIVAPDDLFEYF